MTDNTIEVPEMIVKTTRRCPKWYFELFYHYAASSRTYKEAYERLEAKREKYGFDRRFKNYPSFCRNLYRYRHK